MEVFHSVISQEECLAWSAFQFSVPVKDTDRDGLLNIWESSQAANLLDPADNQPIPNLWAMRARDDVQDVFIEIGFTTAAAQPITVRIQTANASGLICEEETRPARSLAPANEGRARFGCLGIPVKEKLCGIRQDSGWGLGPINIHFDVGGNYQTDKFPQVIPRA